MLAQDLWKCQFAHLDTRALKKVTHFFSGLERYSLLSVSDVLPDLFEQLFHLVRVSHGIAVSSPPSMMKIDFFLHQTVPWVLLSPFLAHNLVRVIVIDGQSKSCSSMAGSKPQEPRAPWSRCGYQGASSSPEEVQIPQTRFNSRGWLLCSMMDDRLIFSN